MSQRHIITITTNTGINAIARLTRGMGCIIKIALKIILFLNSSSYLHDTSELTLSLCINQRECFFDLCQCKMSKNQFEKENIKPLSRK